MFLIFPSFVPTRKVSSYSCTWFLAINEWGWVGYEELSRTRRVLSSTLRFVQLCKYSSNSKFRPPSCLLAVFAMFLVIISPSSSCSSYSWNEWNVRHFFFHNQNNSTLSLGNGNSALTCRRLHFWHHFLVKHRILPNLVTVNSVLTDTSIRRTPL